MRRFASTSAGGRRVALWVALLIAISRGMMRVRAVISQDNEVVEIGSKKKMGLNNNEDMDDYRVMKMVFSSLDDPIEPAPSVDLVSWYTTWKKTLQLQIDGLFWELEQGTTMARRLQSIDVDDVHSYPQTERDEDLGFKIVMLGDSTMRMQAEPFSWLLRQRRTADGRKVCHPGSTDKNKLVDVRCKGDDGNILFSVQYTKVWNECVVTGIDANFLYFGCGLHLLQLFPEMRYRPAALNSWIHYERILEEAVLSYRAGNKSTGREGTIGEAFMTTHSFIEERLTGVYKTLVQEYTDGNDTLLDICQAEVRNLGVQHSQWENEFPPEAICARGWFGESGVVNLNRRAERVMDRLGVPIVPAYDLTRGQTWATAVEDGRHYPALFPLEASGMLSEIITALRRRRNA